MRILGVRHLAVLALALAVVLAGGGPVQAGPPTDQLRSHVDRVLKLLETNKNDRTAVRKIATDLFDFEETAKRSLGRHWQQRSPEERRQFVGLFTDLLEHSYFSKIERYQGEKVSYVGESVEGDQALVRTKIVTPQGTEIPVDYRMERRDDRWKVYDVSIEGVSLVANYRTQFDKIIQTSSYQALVDKMKSRAFTAPGGGERKAQR